MIIVNIIIIII